VISPATQLFLLLGPTGVPPVSRVVAVVGFPTADGDHASVLVRWLPAEELAGQVWRGRVAEAGDGLRGALEVWSGASGPVVDLVDVDPADVHPAHLHGRQATVADLVDALVDEVLVDAVAGPGRRPTERGPVELGG